MLKFILAIVILTLTMQLVVASEYYKVNVTRISDDLYKDNTSGVYILTRYCYEYVYYEDAILKIVSTYGFKVGEIVFIDSGGSKCDVAKSLN